MDISCQSPAAVGEHNTVTFPLMSLFHWRSVFMETLSVFVTHCTTSSLGKEGNASEGSIFLVTCCSLSSGSSAKGCLQAPHSFEPFCFPKILLLTYFLTPWSRINLEKLTVNFAASQEIPRIYATRKSLTAPTSARHLSLSWANSIQSPQPPPTSWRSI
jgi:hypothetical protein